MIICITGLPGSGKTTFATLLKSSLEKNNYQVIHYTSDFVREKLFIEKLWQEGNVDRDFSPTELTCSYNGLFMLIQELINQSPNVVLITDGTYRDAASRIILENIATKLNNSFQLIKISTPTPKREFQQKLRFKQTGQAGKFSGTYEEPYGPNIIHVKNSGSLNLLKKKAQTVLQQLSLNQPTF